MSGLPSRVRIVEVGPRDGLQHEPEVLSVDARVAFIEALADAGLPVIEVGAFVRPDRVPQMAATDEVVRRLPSRPGIRYLALVPNRRGLERAFGTGLAGVVVFPAASEAFSQANLGASIDASLARFREVAAGAAAAGLWVRGVVSTAWWCPYSGPVEPDAVRRVAFALLEMGCEEVTLADTIGAATPVEVRALLERLLREIALHRLGVHLHDTRGTALANVLAALELGLASVDASAGGLGGCPFAPGALGNLATEDLLYMLHGMGIATGVDLEKVRSASLALERALGRRVPSRYAQAGPLRPAGASRSV
ncbi:MAG: hydroxymethylglutaryl-CoA lyase [Armatimonadota bacterium]|nr:hydroxymethylglutaryl-CoA lyase [Armatimonadota bacterium]